MFVSKQHPQTPTSGYATSSFSTTTTKTKTKATDEKRPIIEKYLREHPNIPLKRIVHAIQINENLVVSEAMVRAVRKQVENA